MTTKKKVTKKKVTPKRRKPRRFGVSIYAGEAHLGWLGTNDEEERDGIIQKAKKHPLVDRIEVMDRKGRNYNEHETHLRLKNRWKEIHTSDFLP